MSPEESLKKLESAAGLDREFERIANRDGAEFSLTCSGLAESRRRRRIGGEERVGRADMARV